MLVHVLGLLGTSNAAISLPSIYGSHMVLQAGQPGELWGIVSPTAKVSAACVSVSCCNHSLGSGPCRFGSFSGGV